MTDQNNAAQAIQEAERIAAADEYFKARTWLMDTTDNRRIFEAGFDRAYALLSKLRAEGVQAGDEPPGGTRWPVLRAMARNYTAGKHTWDALDADACEQGAEEIRHLRAALASAPVAGEAQPVAWMVYASDTHQLKRIVQTDPGDTAAFGCLKLPLYAAPQADKDGAEQALKDLVTHGVSVQRIAPADIMAGGQQRAGDAEPIAWECTTTVFFKYVTDSKYRKFRPGVQKWYRPYRCASCAALSALQAEQGRAKP